MTIPCAGLARLAGLAAVLSLSAARRLRKGDEGAKGRCVALKNEGVYFGVDVEVGVPPQNFTLVADTGSNNLIVVSCACQDAGLCDGAKHCYRGTNRSSTFSIGHKPKSMAITFGSGTVGTVRATEKASVGGVSARMPDDFLLLVNDAALNLGGATFEGILGLGIPGAEAEMQGEDQTRYPKSFLEDAHVTSFSMCVNAGSDGALRLNDTLVNPVRSVGKAHWGVGLAGITVGGTGADAAGGATLVSCSPADEQRGYETPCGLIPDSGTTLMLGPKTQVLELYATLCTKWSRCNSEHEKLMSKALADGGQNLTEDQRREIVSASPAVKVKLFIFFLAHCDRWMEKSEDFGDLPSLQLNITDGGNHSRLLELTPWSYIMEGVAQAQSEVDVGGLPPAVGSLLQQTVAWKPGSGTANTTGGRRVCQPAFDVMEYGTKANGQVWIFGTPLFYQYQVGYDLASKALSFTKLGQDGPSCAACSTGGTGQALLTLGGRAQKRLRRIEGTPRRPSIDTTQPL